MKTKDYFWFLGDPLRVGLSILLRFTSCPFLSLSHLGLPSTCLLPNIYDIHTPGIVQNFTFPNKKEQNQVLDNPQYGV